MSFHYLLFLLCSFVSCSDGSRSLGFLPGRLIRRDSFRQNARLALAKSQSEVKHVETVLFVECGTLVCCISFSTCRFNG